MNVCVKGITFNGEWHKPYPPTEADPGSDGYLEVWNTLSGDTLLHDDIRDILCEDKPLMAEVQEAARRTGELEMLKKLRLYSEYQHEIEECMGRMRHD